MKTCTKCNIPKEEKDFYKLKGWICKECHKKSTKEYYFKNRDRYIERSKKYQKQDSQKEANRFKAEKWRYKTKYRITLDDYNILYKNQDGKCAVCEQEEKENNKKLSVDHCHKTGKVRGLLCSNCNHGLGNLQDSLEIIQNLLKYLIKNQ